MYHVIDGAVPRHRCCADLTGDFSHTLIGAVKQTGEIADDAAGQYFLQPFGDCLFKASPEENRAKKAV